MSVYFIYTSNNTLPVVPAEHVNPRSRVKTNNPIKQSTNIKDILQSENEQLYALINNMLSSLEIIVSNTEENDPNKSFREGLLAGYTLKVGQIMEEAEKEKEELQLEAINNYNKQINSLNRGLLGGTGSEKADTINAGNQAQQYSNAYTNIVKYNDSTKK